MKTRPDTYQTHKAARVPQYWAYFPQITKHICAEKFQARAVKTHALRIPDIMLYSDQAIKVDGTSLCTPLACESGCFFL